MRYFQKALSATQGLPVWQHAAGLSFFLALVLSLLAPAAAAQVYPIGVVSTVPTEFYSYSVASDGNNAMYVGSMDSSVVAYNLSTGASSTLIAARTPVCPTNAALAFITGLYVHGRNLYIADYTNGRILVWSLDTNSCTHEYRASAPLAIYVDASANLWYASTGSQVGRFAAGAANGATPTIVYDGSGSFLSGIQMDSNQDLYFSDADSKMVRKLTAASGYALSSLTNYPVPFASYSLAVDADGNFYLNNTLLGPTEDFVLTKASGYTNIYPVTTGLTDATQINIDSAGRIFAASLYSNSIYVIQPGARSLGPQLYNSAAGVDYSFSIKAETTYTGWNYLDQGQSPGIYSSGTASNPCQNPNGSAYTAPSDTVCNVRLNVDHLTYNGVGEFKAAVQVLNGSSVLATGNVSAVESGPVVEFQPAVVNNFAGTGSTCSGNPSACGDGSAATSAKLASPKGTAVDNQGNVYIAANVIRKVDVSGNITTLAGNGTTCAGSTSSCGDGALAVNANLSSPSKLALDGAGNLYIADTGDNRIRMVNLYTGVISTVAGNGTACSNATTACGDGGLATSANLSSPTGLAVDGSGNLYIGDSGDYRIRKVSAATGIISTLAGSGVTCSDSTTACGDGGLATAALLGSTNDIKLDASGNLYFADATANRVRKITVSTGLVTAYAGSGTACSASTDACGDGAAATSASLSKPGSIDLDPAGNLYIADYTNNRIRFVNQSTGLVKTIMGTGDYCDGGLSTCGDGASALNALLLGPTCVTYNPNGSLLVCDNGEHRVRSINFGASAMSFADSVVGTQSSDSPQSVEMLNVGSSLLSFTTSLDYNPYLDEGYSLDSSSTCYDNHADVLLPGLMPNESCHYAVDFIPTMVGPMMGSLYVFDNDMGKDFWTYGTQQKIALSGNGQDPVTQLVFTYAPNTPLVAGSSTGSIEVSEEDGSGQVSSSATDTITLVVTQPDSTTQTYTAQAANGVASFGSFNPTLSGNYSYVASIVSNSSVATATATEVVNPGQATDISLSSGSGQSTVLGSAFATALSVLVKDSYGNPVPYAAVTFSAPTSGASATLGTPMAITTSAGLASTTATTVTAAGSYNVTAITAGPVSSPLTATTAAAGHSVKANYGVLSTSFALTNLKATPDVTVAASAAMVAYGTATTLTSTVTSTVATPSGTVTFYDNGLPLMTVAITSTTASYTTTLGGGSHVVTALYDGDANFNTQASTSGVNVNVTQATTAATVTSSNNPAVWPSSIRYTATFTTAAGGVAPTGTVTFTDGGSSLGTTSVSSGVANLYTSASNPGAHTIVAVYNGDANYMATSSANFTETVNKATPVVALSLSASTMTYGASPTYTATVTGYTKSTEAGAEPMYSNSPTGTVGFYDGSTLLQTSTLTGGVASYTQPLPTGGSHTVTAVYNGDVDYLSLTSAAHTVTVNAAATTITILSSANPVNYGTSATYSVTLGSVSSGLAPTGAVSFYDGSTLLGQVAAISGAASYTQTLPAVGAHSITAVYAGDVNYTTVTSSVLTETVNKLTPTVTLTTSANPVFLNTAVVYTATVTGAVSGLPASGTVSFYDGTTLLGSSTVASGNATLSQTLAAAGSHAIKATYNGDGNYLLANSTALAEVAQDFTLALTANGSTQITITPGQTATFQLVVTPTVNTTFPAAITLTATGGSSTTTLTLGQTTIASGATTATITLSAATTKQIARMLEQERRVQFRNKIGSISIALLLLPLLGGRSRRRWQRYMSLLVLAIGGALSMAALTGCGATTGYFGQQPATYTVTVTGTSGALTHTTTVSLTIE